MGHVAAENSGGMLWPLLLYEQGFACEKPKRQSTTKKSCIARLTGDTVFLRSRACRRTSASMSLPDRFPVSICNLAVACYLDSKYEDLIPTPKSYPNMA